MWLERTFAENNWPPAWRHTVYGFTHFHSTCHEVMGVFQGSARLHFGNSAGTTLEVAAADVIIIPAGVAHRRLESSPDFCAVGAYPSGQRPDLLRGVAADRPAADENIAHLPLPATDPIFGREGCLLAAWQAATPAGRERAPVDPHRN